jgi:CRISPR-associated protein Csb2
MGRREGRRSRQQWHVTLQFDRPVRGPVVLGAGRYRGYGLMVPLDGGEGDAFTNGD